MREAREPIEKWWISTVVGRALADQVAVVARQVLEARVGRLDEDLRPYPAARSTSGCPALRGRWRRHSRESPATWWTAGCVALAASRGWLSCVTALSPRRPRGPARGVADRRGPAPVAAARLAVRHSSQGVRCLLERSSARLPPPRRPCLATPSVLQELMLVPDRPLRQDPRRRRRRPPRPDLEEAHRPSQMPEIAYAGGARSSRQRLDGRGPSARLRSQPVEQIGVLALDHRPRVVRAK